MKPSFTFYYLILFITFQTFAQAPSVKKYDLKKKRLLIQSCSMYLFNSNQGAIDIDSSVVLACKAYRLPVLLAYDEGFNDGSYLIGNELIEKGNINSAKKLLATSKNEDKIKLLLQLGNFYLFKTGTKPQDLQNAHLYIKEAVDVSNQIKIKKWQHQSLLLLGKYYVQANNLSESKNCFVKVINECRKQNDKPGLADALDGYGTLLSNLDPEKEKILEEAISIYASLGMEEKRIENYMKITTIYFWTGKINEAKKRLYQNLVDLRKIGFTHEQFDETTISYIELNQYNMKNALYYALKSVKRMEAEKDYTLADVFYIRLDNVYNVIGYNETALDLYKKSVQFGQKGLNSGHWYRSFLSAVSALSIKGKNKEAINYINSMTINYPPTNTFDKMMLAYTKANCYAALKNYNLAEKNYTEIDHYSEQLIAPETVKEVIVCYTSAAFFYATIHQAKKAKSYADKATALSKKYKTQSNKIISK